MQILEWLVLYLISRIPKGESYVRMLVVREIRLHNGANCCAIPTTQTERGYYLQQSGGSKWLLALEFILYMHCDDGPIGPYSWFIARISKRKEEQKDKSKKKNDSWLLKNGLTSMEKQDDLVDRRGLRSESQR